MILREVANCGDLESQLVVVIMVTILTLDLEDLLDLVIQHKYEGTTSTSEYVGERSLEESTSSFRLGDGSPAVKCVLVQDVSLGAARLHHHAPTDSVEGIGDDTGDCCNGLCDGPANDDWCVLGVG